jgi:hypothetical protein
MDHHSQHHIQLHLLCINQRFEVHQLIVVARQIILMNLMLYIRNGFGKM